jgi:hypothetical protein
MKIITTSIEYDTDDNLELDKILPQNLTFTFKNIREVEATLVDRISDKTGFCVFSCEYTIKSKKK